MSSAFRGVAVQHLQYDRPANTLSWEITFGQTYDRFQDRLAWKLLVSDTISGSSPCLLCVEDKASILLVLYPYTAERRDVLENTPPEAQEISQGRGWNCPCMDQVATKQNWETIFLWKTTYIVKGTSKKNHSICIQNRFSSLSLELFFWIYLLLSQIPKHFCMSWLVKKKLNNHEKYQ